MIGIHGFAADRLVCDLHGVPVASIPRAPQELVGIKRGQSPNNTQRRRSGRSLPFSRGH